MSYEATYSSRVNTRLVRQSTANICDGTISLVSSIRDTVQEGIRIMNGFMNQSVTFPCTVVGVKTEIKNNIMTMIKKNLKLSVSQCYIKTLTNHSITKNIVENVPSFKIYGKAQNLTGRKAFKISEQVLNETISEIEKTFVDVKTVLTVQAITTCGWQIVDTNTEKTSQTLIAQNNEGTVLAVQISPEKMSIDVAGLCGSSCKAHVKKVMEELRKLGIETKVDNENEHRKRGGGTLLSFSNSAESVSKVAKMRESIKKKKNLTFQTNNCSSSNSLRNNCQKERKRECN